MKNSMQAILAIIQAQDAETTLEWLKVLNLPSLEQIASSGSFLRENNTALWLVVRPEQVEPVFNVLRHTCHRRAHFAPAYLAETATMIFALPLEVEVGGAIVFSFAVEHYEVF